MFKRSQSNWLGFKGLPLHYIHWCSCRFWKIRRKTTVPVSFLKEAQDQACNFFKNMLRHMFSCDFCKVLKNTFFTEYFQESAFELISLRIFYVWISENRCQNVKKYFRCYSYCYSTISVGTWGGRSSMQDQLKTISLSPLNLEKRPTAKKCRRIWKLWRQNKLRR